MHDDLPADTAGDATADRQFKAFRRFNAPELRPLAGLRARLDDRMFEHFPGDGLPDRIVRELASHRVLNMKEVFESFELFERVRKRLRAPEVADLCAGHGLTGLLFAVFEPVVARVVLLDRRRPPSALRALEAVTAVAPWVREKVTYIEAPLAKARDVVSEGASLVAVHACGVRTDRVLDLGIALHAKIAVMPCCYAQTAADAPRAHHETLGTALATDIHRTYRLEAAGYEVDWSAVPRAVTARNRILVASLRAGDAA